MLKGGQFIQKTTANKNVENIKFYRKQGKLSVTRNIIQNLKITCFTKHTFICKKAVKTFINFLKLIAFKFFKRFKF